jgi:hypothetical protein
MNLLSVFFSILFANQLENITLMSQNEKMIVSTQIQISENQKERCRVQLTGYVNF